MFKYRTLNFYFSQRKLPRRKYDREGNISLLSNQLPCYPIQNRPSNSLNNWEQQPQQDCVQAPPHPSSNGDPYILVCDPKLLFVITIYISVLPLSGTKPYTPNCSMCV